MTRKSLDPLTSIRFFAALLVVMAHYGATLFQARSPLHFLKPIIDEGFVAVSLFFCLSGFVLAYSYAQKRISLRQFWKARFARIYPLYLLALLLSIPIVFQQWITHDRHMQTACVVPCTTGIIAASLALTPVMLQSWNPATASVFNPPSWSLSVEAFLYFLFPFLMRLKLFRNPIRSAVLVFGVVGAWFTAGALPGVVTLVLTFHPSSTVVRELALYTWYSPLAHVPSFFAGMLVGCFYTQRRNDREFSRWGNAMVTGAVLFAFGILSWIPGSMGLLLQTGLLIPIWSCLFLGLAYQTRIARYLSNPVLVFLGNASYGLYILQQPVSSYFRWFYSKITGTPFARDYSAPLFLVYLVLLIGISCACYHFIESPIREGITRSRESRLRPAAVG